MWKRMKIIAAQKAAFLFDASATRSILPASRFHNLIAQQYINIMKHINFEMI